METRNIVIQRKINSTMNSTIIRKELIMFKKELIDTYQNEVNFDIAEYIDNFLFEKWMPGMCTIPLDVYLCNENDDARKSLEFYSKLDKYVIPSKYLKNLFIKLILHGTLWTFDKEFSIIKEQMNTVLENQFEWVDIFEFQRLNPEYK